MRHACVVEIPICPSHSGMTCNTHPNQDYKCTYRYRKLAFSHVRKTSSSVSRFQFISEPIKKLDQGSKNLALHHHHINAISSWDPNVPIMVYGVTIPAKIAIPPCVPPHGSLYHSDRRHGGFVKPLKPAGRPADSRSDHPIVTDSCLCSLFSAEKQQDELSGT